MNCHKCRLHAASYTRHAKANTKREIKNIFYEKAVQCCGWLRQAVFVLERAAFFEMNITVTTRY
jgi:hypothetical protein